MKRVAVKKYSAYTIDHIEHFDISYDAIFSQEKIQNSQRSLNQKEAIDLSNNMGVRWLK